MPKITAYRRAAVALHELHEEDQQWILDALPGEERSAVTQCLEEMKALGFARIVSPPHAPPHGISLSHLFPLQAKQPVDLLRHATATQMFAILENEPSSLIVQLMAIQSWPWAAAFLQMFSPIRRERIRTALAGKPVTAPARNQFLLDAVANRLKQQSMEVAQPSAKTARILMTCNQAMRQMLAPFFRSMQSWKR